MKTTIEFKLTFLSTPQNINNNINNYIYLQINYTIITKQNKI